MLWPVDEQFAVLLSNFAQSMMQKGSLVLFLKYKLLFLGINDIGANMLWPVDDFDNSRVHGRRWT